MSEVAMRVIVLGADGYLGFPTAMYFSRAGHEVWAVDNGMKRQLETRVGVEPLAPVPPLQARIGAR